MEQSPSWEANRLSASQEIPLIYFPNVWNKNLLALFILKFGTQVSRFPPPHSLIIIADTTHYEKIYEWKRKIRLSKVCFIFTRVSYVQ